MKLAGEVSKIENNNGNSSANENKRRRLSLKFLCITVSVLLVLLLLPSGAIAKIHDYIYSNAFAGDPELVNTEAQSAQNEDQNLDVANLGVVNTDPYLWDFSEYENTKTLSGVSKNSGTSTVYSEGCSTIHSTSVAAVTLYGPSGDNSKSNTVGYNSSEKTYRFQTTYCSTSNNSVKGSYIKFVPTINLKSITLSAKYYSNTNTSIKITQATTTDGYPDSSKAFDSVYLTDKYKNVVFKPDGGLKAGTAYYIFSSNSQAKKAGMVVKSIRAEASANCEITGSIKSDINGKVNISFTDSNKAVVSDTLTVSSTEETSFSLEGNFKNTTGVLRITPTNGRTFEYSITSPISTETVDLGTFDISDYFPRIYGTLKNLTGNTVLAQVHFGNASTMDIPIPPSSEAAFKISNYNIGDSGIISVSCNNNEISVQEKYLPYADNNTNAGQFIINNYSSSKVTIQNYEDGAQNNVYAHFSYGIPTIGSSERYWVSVDDNNEYSFTMYDRDSGDAFAYVKYSIEQASLYLYKYNDEAQNKISNELLLTGNLTTKLTLPTYEWSGEGPDGPYTCEASILLNGITISETVTTQDGSITSAITKKPTSYSKGIKTFTTVFKNTLYFSQQSYDVEIPESESHTHDDITFEEWTSKNSLPSPASGSTESYYLAEDITLDSGSRLSNIPSNSTLNLCLNGHYIYYASSSGTKPLFKVDGKLNLYDDETKTADSVHYFTEDWQLITNPSDFGTAAHQVTGAVISGSKYCVAQTTSGSGRIYSQNVNAIGNSSNSVNGSVFNGTTKTTLEDKGTSYSQQQYNVEINGGQFSGNYVNFGTAVGGAIGTANSISWYVKTTNALFTYNHASYDQGGAISLGMTGGKRSKLYVDECEFYHNYSGQKGGAIFFKQTDAFIKDTIMKYNYVGTGSFVDQTCWGGAIVGNDNDGEGQCSILTLAGLIDITDNYNYGKKNYVGCPNPAQDNLNLEMGTADPNTGAYAKITLDSNYPLSEGSIIGVNTLNWKVSPQQPFYGVVSIGYVSLIDANNPELKYFIADNILDPNNYSIALTKEEGHFHEVKIIKHIHNLEYELMKDQETDMRTNTLKTWCDCGTADIICKYEDENGPIYATLAFDDDNSEHEIKFDGKEHPASISNYYELSNNTPTKLTEEGITYYKQSFNSETGAEEWTKISGVPTQAGTYKAHAEFRLGHVDGSGQVTYDKTNAVVESNNFTILNKTLKLVVVGKERPFRTNSIAEPEKYVDNTVAEFSNYALEGIQPGDEVNIDISKFRAYMYYIKDGKREKGGFAGLNTIDEFDESSVVLTGKNAADYTITEIEGSCNIIPADQNISKSDMSLLYRDNPPEPIYPYFSNVVAGTEFYYPEQPHFYPTSKIWEDDEKGYVYQYDPNTQWEDSDWFKAYYYPVDVNGDDNIDFNGIEPPDRESTDPDPAIVINVNAWSSSKRVVTFVADPLIIGGEPVDAGKISLEDGDNVIGVDDGYWMGYHFFKDASNNNYQTVVYVDGGTFPSQYQNVYCFAYPTDNTKYEFDHWEMVGVKQEGEQTELVTKFYPEDIEKAGAEGLNGWAGFGDTETKRETDSKNREVVFHAVFKEVDKPSFSVNMEPVIQDPVTLETGEVVALGKKIKYKVTVTNTGNCTLKDIKLTDVLCGYSQSKPLEYDGTLIPGQSWIIDVVDEGPSTLEYYCQETDIMAGSITNNVIVNSSYEPIGSTDTKTLDSQTISSTTNTVAADKSKLDISIQSSTNGKVHLNDTISKYIITVTNNCNVTISNIRIEDTLVKTDNQNSIKTEITLKPGESYVLETLPYVVRIEDINQTTKTITNTAKAYGEFKSSDEMTEKVFSNPTSVQVSNAMASTEIEPPTPKTNLVYSATNLVGVEAGDGYTLDKNEGFDAGQYTTVATLKDWCVWKMPDGTTSDKPLTLNWSIAKKKLTVNSIDPEAKVYDGSPYVYENLANDITGWAVETEGLTSASMTTKSSNAGVYTQTSEFDIVYNLKDGTKWKNYSLTYGDINIEIKKKNLSDNKIHATAENRVYNGQTQSTSVSVVYTLDDKTINLTSSDYHLDGTFSAKDAHEGYQVTVVAEENSNYTGSKTAKWNISKANLTINVVGKSGLVEYNKKEQSVKGWDATISSGETEYIKLDTNKILPKSDDCVAKGTNVGSYSLRDKNGAVVSVDSFSYSDNNINASFTYSGGKLEIKQKDISKSADIEIIGRETVYNGSLQNAPIEVYDGETRLTTASYTLSGNVSAINADEYSVTVTGQGNYCGYVSGTTWKITPKKVDISCATQTGIYDGNVFSYELETIPIIGKDDCIKTTFTTKGSKVGEYVYKLEDSSLDIKTEKGNNSTVLDNFDINYIEGITLKITARKANVVPKDRTVTYTGDYYKLIDNQTTCSNLLDGHSIKAGSIKWNKDDMPYEEGYKDADTYNIAVSELIIVNSDNVDVTENYDLDFSKKGILKINKAKMTISIVGNISADKTTNEYNGQDQTISGYEANEKEESDSYKRTNLFDINKLSPGKDQCVAKGCDAGKYCLELADTNEEITEDSFSYDDNNIDASFEYTEGYIEIFPRTLSISANRSKGYDGNVFKHELTTSAEGGSAQEIVGVIEGESVNGWLQTTGSAVRDYTQKDTDFTYGFTYGDNTKEDNYSISFGNVCLSIIDKTVINIVGNHSTDSNPYYYSGQTQYIEGFSASASADWFDASKVKLINGKQAYVSGFNAGHYTMGLTVNDFIYDDASHAGMYELRYVDGYLDINKKSITPEMITASPNEFVYNAYAQGPTITITNGEEVLTPRDYTVEDGTKVDVGDYSAIITGVGPNYTGTVTSQNCSGLKYKIIPADMEITVIGNTDSVVYNGSIQTLIGYSAADTSEIVLGTFDESKISPSKQDCIISGTNAGIYDMGLFPGKFSYADNNVKVSFKVTDGQLNIGKKSLKELDYTCEDTSYVYDAKDKSPIIRAYDNKTLVPQNEQYVVTGDVTKTNAGNYTITILPSDNSNYKDSVEIKWTITRVNLKIDIYGNNNTCEYNTLQQSVNGYSYEKSEAGEEFFNENKLSYIGNAEVTRTDVGTDYMRLDVNKFIYNDPNINALFNIAQDGYISITPVDITNSDVVKIIVKNLEFTYDGNIKQPSVELSQGDYKLIEKKDFSIYGNTASLAGNYVLKIEGVRNYTNTVTYDWVINKAVIETKVKGHTAAVNYTGSSQYVYGYDIEETTSTNLLNESFVSPEKGNCSATGVDAGIYNMKLNEAEWSYTDKDNIEFKTPKIESDGYIEIVKQNAFSEITATNLTYNGQTQKTSAVVKYKNSSGYDIVLTEDQDYIISDGQGCDVYEHYQVTATGIGNFQGASISCEWAIVPAVIDINIYGESQSLVYNGQDQSISGYSATSTSNLFDVSKLFYEGSLPSAEGKDVGTYTAQLEPSNFKYQDNNNVLANVSVVSNTILNIAKKDITVSATTTFAYDVTATNYKYKLTSSDVVGLADDEAIVEGEDTSYLITNSNYPGHNYNTYSNKFSGFSSMIQLINSSSSLEVSVDNYNITYSVSLYVADVTNTVSVVGHNLTTIYSGSFQTIEGFDGYSEMSGFNPSNIKLKESFDGDSKIAAASGKDVGVYYMGLTSDDFEYVVDGVVQDVTFAYTDGYIKINPKEITREMIKISPTQFIFNGKTQGPNVEFVNDDNISTQDYTINEGSAINAGSYFMSIVGTHNYCGTVSGINWNITPKNLYIKANATQEYSCFQYVYNIDPENDVDGLCETDTISGTLTTNGSDIGTYNILGSGINNYSSNITAVYPALLSNYNVIYNSSLTIAKKKLTIKGKEDAFVYPYDGIKHYVYDGDLVFDGLIVPNSLTVNSWSNNGLIDVGSINNVRPSSVTIKDYSGRIITDFYDITYKDISLVVQKANIKISVVGNSSSITYDGVSHDIIGYSASEISRSEDHPTTGLFELSKLHAKSQCKASGIDPGTYEMVLSSDNFEYVDSNIDAEIVCQNGVLQINQKSLDMCTITLSNFTYNASEQTTNIIVKYEDQVLEQNVDYVVKPEESTISATSADTYKVVIQGKDGSTYSGTKEAFWTIFKANIEINIFGLVEKHEYSGNMQTIPAEGQEAFSATEENFSGVFDKSNIESPVYSASGKNLGQYNMGIDINKFSYKDDNVIAKFNLINDGQLNIVAKSITEPSFIAYADDLTYNGSVQTTNVGLYDSDRLLVQGVDYNVEGVMSAKDFGTYSLRFVGIGSYKDTISNVTWSMNKAKLKIGITGSQKSVIYNGYWQEAGGYSAVLADGSSKVFDSNLVKLNGSAKDVVGGVNAGTYTKNLNDTDFSYLDNNVDATFVALNPTNDEGAIAQIILNIQKRELLIRATDIKTEDSSRLVHVLQQGEIEGAVASQIITGTVETNNNEVGIYQVPELIIELKVDGKDLNIDSNGDEACNYSVSDASTLIIVAPKSEEIYIYGQQSICEYDGQSHSVSGYKAVCANPLFDESKLVITPGSDVVTRINAGQQKTNITATYDGTPIPDSNIFQGQLTINKRSLTNETVTWQAITNFTYNGLQQYPNSVTIKDNVYEGALTEKDYSISSPAEGSSIVPGDYSLHVEATADGNYKDSFDIYYSVSNAIRIIKVVGNTEEVNYSPDAAPFRVDGYTLTECNELKQPVAAEDKLIDLDSIKPKSSEVFVESSNVGEFWMGLNDAMFIYEGQNAPYIQYSFEVTDGKLTVNSVNFDNVVLDAQDLEYNASPQMPNVIRVESGGDVVDPSNYNVICDKQIDANEGEDKYTLTVVGINNYAGTSQTTTWTIKKAKRDVTIIGTQTEIAYTGVEESSVGYSIDEDISGGKKALINEADIVPISNDCFVKASTIGKHFMNLKDKDFKYLNSRNVDVTFNFIDGYLNIVNRSLKDVSTQIQPKEIVYDKKSHFPEITLNNGEVVLVKDVDYYLEDAQDPAASLSKTEVGEYKVKVIAVEGSPYKESFELVWKIVPATFNVVVFGNIKTAAYNGSEQKSEGWTVKLEDEEKYGELFDKDKVKCSQEDVAAKGTEVGSYTTKLDSSKFSYDDESGNVKVSRFLISNDVQLDINSKNIDSPTINAEASKLYYTGQPQKPSFIVTDEETGKVLEEGRDYEILCDEQTNVGDSYTAQIIGKENSNYNNYKTVNWSIEKLQLLVNIKGNTNICDYNGARQYVKGYSFNGLKTASQDMPAGLIGLFDPSKANLSIIDYGTSGIDAGDYILNLQSWKYEDPNVDVTPVSITNGLLTIKPISISNVNFTWTNPEYNGKEQTVQNVTGTYGTYSLNSLDDFDVVCDGQTEAGDYSFTAKANEAKNKNFKFENELVWKITPRVLTITMHTSSVHTGSPIEGSFNEQNADRLAEGQTVAGTFITKDSAVGDYIYDTGLDLKTIEFKAGATTISKDNYEITYDASISIGSTNIQSCTWETKVLTYNGKKQYPVFDSIKFGDDDLQLNKDYKIKENVDYGQRHVGEYPFVIQGINNFSGELECNYKIVPKEIKINVSKAKTYDNSPYVVAISSNSEDNNFEGLCTHMEGENEVKDALTAIATTILKTTGQACADAATYKLNGEKFVIKITDFAGADDGWTKASDYKITESSDLIINKKAVEIHPNVNMGYNGECFEYTYNSTKNYNSDNTESLDISGVIFGQEIWGTVVTNNSKRGEYSSKGEGDNQWSVKVEPQAGRNVNLNNYDISYNNLVLTITKADLTIAPISSQEYNGEKFAYNFDSKCITGLAKNEGFTGTATTNDVNVGTYEGSDVIFSNLEPQGLTDPENYNISYQPKLDITPKAFDKNTIEVIYTNALRYNGQEQNPTTLENFQVKDKGSGKELSNEDYTINVSSKTDVGNTYKFSVYGKRNYNETSLSLNWEITKFDVVVNISDFSKEYDGSVLEYTLIDSDVSSNVAGIARPNEIFSGMITSSSKNAGEYKYNDPTNSIIVESLSVNNGEKSLDNYDITYNIDSKLTINAKPVELKIEKTQEYNNNSFQYTYSKQDWDNQLIGSEWISGTFDTESVNKGTYIYKNAAGDTLTHKGQTTSSDTLLSNYNISYDVKLIIGLKSFIDVDDGGDIVIRYKDSYIYSGEDINPTAQDFYIYDQAFSLDDPLSSDNYRIEVIPQKDKGTYSFTIYGDGNYESTNPIVKNWSITAKSVTIKAEDQTRNTKIYDKQVLEYKLDSSDISGLADTDTVKGSFVTENYDAGVYSYINYDVGYSVKIVWDEESKALLEKNYQVNYEDIYLTITQRYVDVTAYAEKTFDGEVLTYNISSDNIDDFSDDGVVEGDKLVGIMISGAADAGIYNKNNNNLLISVEAYDAAVTNINNYNVNLKTAKIVIKPVDIDSNSITINFDNPLTYNAYPQRPDKLASFSVVYTTATGIQFVLDSFDYEVTGDFVKDVCPVDSQTLTITGKGNYQGTRTVNWGIVPYEFNYTMEDVPSKTYDAKPLSFEIYELDIVDGLLGEDVLNLEAVTIENGEESGNAGLYELNEQNGPKTLSANLVSTEFTNANNYILKFKGSAEILKKDINDSSIEVSFDDDYYYNGNYQKPEVEVRDTKLDIVLGSDDIDIVCDDAIDANIDDESYAFTITATENGNYTGSITGQWHIKPIDFALDLKDEKVYDGKPFQISGEIETGIVRQPEGVNEAFSYSYTTNSADIGDYEFSGESDSEITGSAEPIENKYTYARNYVLTQNVELSITGEYPPTPPEPDPDPPTPDPQPVPDNPVFPGVQTGDFILWIGLEVLALGFVCFMILALRRKRKNH